jgi:hypothetical protein
MRLPPALGARFVLRFHTAAGIRSSKSQLRPHPFRIYYGSCSYRISDRFLAPPFLQVGCQVRSIPLRVMHTSQLLYYNKLISSGFQRVGRGQHLSMSFFLQHIPRRAMGAKQSSSRLDPAPAPRPHVPKFRVLSLEEQMPGKPRSCRESATQQRVQ